MPRPYELTLALTAACSAGSPPGPSAPPSSASAGAPATPVATAPVTATAPVPAAAPLPRAAAASAPPDACGPLGCLAFESAKDAFRRVLERRPRVLAIGETHAQSGATVPSATRRFTEALLPELAGKASDLVLELWVSAGSCGAVEADVAERQKPVTERQAAGNQSEFMALGQRAKALGVTPHALVPTCDEYRSIAGAGVADIERMLEMLARATERDLSKRLDATADRSPPPLIVAYGGALHNDRAPRPGRERWAFGPALAARLGDGYVELDLIVPEFVKDTESWRAFAWYDAYRASRRADRNLLYATAPNAFVLVFAETKP